MWDRHVGGSKDRCDMCGPPANFDVGVVVVACAFMALMKFACLLLWEPQGVCLGVSSRKSCSFRVADAESAA